ncbi:head-tail connector protein [Staphylococcus saprophyticus]|uniref:head-tail connector protein n=1 Tax=Staphylococcus saprophyticus TaxID=29385 RepID=UPI00085314E6|nr:head-tail connector protein [Staphylococcus saprophyticus]OEK41302.1 hypothetical protein ASS88_01445 [Staphylococcus saprophyticus]
MDLETLKLHLKVSHSMEDSLIEMYQAIAEEDIKQSVFPDTPTRNEEFFKDNKIFEYAVFLRTASMYENRFEYSDVQLVEVPKGVTNCIQKLRGAYPYES